MQALQAEAGSLDAAAWRKAAAGILSPYHPALREGTTAAEIRLALSRTHQAQISLLSGKCDKMVAVPGALSLIFSPCGQAFAVLAPQRQTKRQSTRLSRSPAPEVEIVHMTQPGRWAVHIYSMNSASPHAQVLAMHDFHDHDNKRCTCCKACSYSDHAWAIGALHEALHSMRLAESGS